MRRMTSDHWHLPYSKDLPAHFWRQVELGLLAHESHDLLPQQRKTRKHRMLNLHFKAEQMSESIQPTCT